MNIIKQIKNNQKPKITIFALAAMLFMLIIISLAYMGTMNKVSSQNRKVSKIEKNYNDADNIDQKYIETLNNLDKFEMEQARKNGMFEKNTNTEVTDEFGNKIMLPAGFKITQDADNVTQGIVIEDKAGNQFVWIPVGEIYTNQQKTQSKIIELGRYEFDENGIPSIYSSDEYIEETISEHKNSGYKNKIAKNINEFKASVINNNGYYIGRYEAGIIGYNPDNIIEQNSEEEINWTGYQVADGQQLQLVSKSGEQVWNYITQNKAAELSQNMYKADSYTSDLINSYAWDTALVFIRNFSDDNNYANKGMIQETLAKTGEEKDSNNNTNDDRCNIYDMAGNCMEWSTESCVNEEDSVIKRGSHFKGAGYAFTKTRSLDNFYNAIDSISFRPILYIN